MEPLTIIDGTFVKDFRLPKENDSCLNGDEMFDKEFMTIFMLTVVMRKMVEDGIHSPINGKNVLVIVDHDRSTFEQRYSLDLFKLITHQSLAIEVVDHTDDIVEKTTTFKKRNYDNKCFMIFNSPFVGVPKIVSEVKPVAFSCIHDVGQSEEVFTSFFALQYAIPNTRFMRMFVFDHEQTMVYERTKLINHMIRVAGDFDHDKWVTNICDIFAFIAINMGREAKALKTLLAR